MRHFLHSRDNVFSDHEPNLAQPCKVLSSASHRMGNETDDQTHSQVDKLSARLTGTCRAAHNRHRHSELRSLTSRAQGGRPPEWPLGNGPSTTTALALLSSLAARSICKIKIDKENLQGLSMSTHHQAENAWSRPCAHKPEGS